MNEDRLKNTLLILYDPDELVDILDINSEELLDRFEDKFTDQLYDEYCGMEIEDEEE